MRETNTNEDRNAATRAPLAAAGCGCARPWGRSCRSSARASARFACSPSPPRSLFLLLGDSEGKAGDSELGWPRRLGSLLGVTPEWTRQKKVNPFCLARDLCPRQGHFLSSSRVCGRRRDTDPESRVPLVAGVGRRNNESLLRSRAAVAPKARGAKHGGPRQMSNIRWCLKEAAFCRWSAAAASVTVIRPTLHCRGGRR